MFGLPTLPKLILIAAIIAVVWYFMRRGKTTRRGNDESSSGQARNKAQGGRNQKPIEDMVQCKACGAYVSAKTGCSCGKSGG